MCQCGGNCSSGCRTGSQSQGQKGNPGRDGVFGGNSVAYLFSTNTAGDPSAGKLLFNNANLSAATVINISATSVSGANVADWLDDIALSTNPTLAHVRVFHREDSTKFVLYKVTMFTDNGTYRTLTVTYLSSSSNSPFQADDPVAFTFSLAGDAGTNGAAGAAVLSNDLVDANSGDTLGVATLQKTGTVPANTLTNDGDYAYVSIKILCNESGLSGMSNIDFDRIKIVCNAGAFVLFLPDGFFANNLESHEYQIKLNRINSSNLRVVWSVIPGYNPTITAISSWGDLTCDFTQDIDVEVYASTSGTISAPGIVTGQVVVEEHLI